MIILDKEGTLYSTARCTGGGSVCGVGRILPDGMVNTQGSVSDDVVRRLTYLAEHHEQRHPTHVVEVTFYRMAELPIQRQMRELFESGR